MPSTAQTAPTQAGGQQPVSYASATQLNELLGGLQQTSQATLADLNQLRIDKWKTDSNNKRVIGQDVLSSRPTLLLALALETLKQEGRGELVQILNSAEIESSATRIERVRQLYQQAQVFESAEKLIEKYRARAEAIADEAQPSELRELLYYLVDTVLERSTPTEEPELELVQLTR